MSTFSQIHIFVAYTETITIILKNNIVLKSLPQWTAKWTYFSWLVPPHWLSLEEAFIQSHLQRTYYSKPRRNQYECLQVPIDGSSYLSLTSPEL